MRSRSRLPGKERNRRAAIVADGSDGIISYCEVFYLYSIIYSADRCLRAFAEHEQAMKAGAPADTLIGSVQEAVGHAAALSRYFWPSTSLSRKAQPLEQLRALRGRKLRRAFSLTSTSPLRSRKLRNAWEHFDERLDEHLLEVDAGAFFPGCLIDDHTLADDPLGHIFKLLDPKAECLVLLGSKYFFGPIRAEVRRVHALATECANAGGRLRVGPNEHVGVQQSQT